MTCKRDEFHAQELAIPTVPRSRTYATAFCNGEGAPYSLHGLNAVWLPDIGGYRIDPRGNRDGIYAQFTPPSASEYQPFLESVPGLFIRPVDASEDIRLTA
jgi:hypothetical protein